MKNTILSLTSVLVVSAFSFSASAAYQSFSCKSEVGNPLKFNVNVAASSVSIHFGASADSSPAARLVAGKAGSLRSDSDETAGGFDGFSGRVAGVPVTLRVQESALKSGEGRMSLLLTDASGQEANYAMTCSAAK